MSWCENIKSTLGYEYREHTPIHHEELYRTCYMVVYICISFYYICLYWIYFVVWVTRMRIAVAQTRHEIWNRTFSSPVTRYISTQLLGIFCICMYNRRTQVYKCMYVYLSLCVHKDISEHIFSLVVFCSTIRGLVTWSCVEKGDWHLRMNR